MSRKQWIDERYHAALCNGSSQDLRACLADGYLPDAVEKRWPSRKAIEVAIEEGNVRAVEVLIEAGVSPESPLRNGGRLLSAVVDAKANRIELAAALLAAGATPDHTLDSYPGGPLHRAISRGDVALVEWLLKNGASPLARDSSGEDALFAAVLAEPWTPEIGSLLLKHGAKVNTRSRNKGTVLFWAAQRGRDEALAFLLKAGAPVDEVDDEGQTALMHVAKRCMLRPLKMLLDAGACIDASDKSGRTALMLACRGHGSAMKAIEALSKAGADLDTRDTDGNSALHIAAGARSALATKALLRAGATVDLRNRSGQTPLMYLVRQLGYGSKRPDQLKGARVIDLLLSAGADPCAIDNAGNSCLSSCRDDVAAVVLLKVATAPNLEERCSLFELAMSLDHLPIALRVLSAGLVKVRSRHHLHRDEILCKVPPLLDKIHAVDPKLTQLVKSDDATVARAIRETRKSLGGASVTAASIIRIAAIDQVPAELLASPVEPKPGRRKRAVVAAEHLASVPDAPILHWERGEQERALSFLPTPASDKAEAKGFQTWIDRLARTPKPKRNSHGEYVDSDDDRFSEFITSAPEVVVKLWQAKTVRSLEFGAEALDWLLARFGERAVPPLAEGPSRSVVAALLRLLHPRLQQVASARGFDGSLWSIRGDAIALSTYRIEAAVLGPWFARLGVSRSLGGLSSDTRGMGILGLNWLLRFPDAASRGLIPQAVGEPGYEREVAEAALRFIAAKGHRRVIAGAARHYGRAAAAEVDAVLSVDARSDWIRWRTSALPLFWYADAHPRPVLKGLGLALPATTIDNLARAMMVSTAVIQDPVVLAAKRRCSASSLARFAWSVFEAWDRHGSPESQWMFQALAYLGDDQCALRLTPRIYTWLRTDAYTKAYKGIEVLLQMGTDVALAQIQQLALNKRYSTLSHYARNALSAAARVRGIELEQLEDRTVPGLGFTKQGVMRLALGSCHIYGRVDVRLKPFLTDRRGSRLSRWPDCADEDDAEAADAARATWMSVVEGLKPIAGLQLQRLELAMVTGRSWTGLDFKKFIVGHPLMSIVGSGLVWSARASDGSIASTFSLERSGQLLDVMGNTVELGDEAGVGLAHPLQMCDVLKAWRQRFARSKRPQPFPQLVRKTYRPQDDSQGDHFGLQNATVETRSLRRLKGLGWRVDMAGTAGLIYSYCRETSAGCATVFVHGAMAIDRADWDDAETRLEVNLPKGLGGIEYSEVVRELQTVRT